MKPEAHKLITKSVLMSFKSLGFSAKESEWICRGASLEDWWSPIQRIRNWHFYRSNDTIKEKESFMFGKSYTTSEIRVENLISKLENKKSYNKQLIVLGRIIHHIQDMSTPSHVIPIYHGPCKKDSYETYMIEYIKDKIDFVSDVNQIDQIDNFMNTYKKFAQKSLKELKEKKVPLFNNTVSNIGYETIWMPYPQAMGKYIGFGDFGKYGDCFNGESMKDDINIDIKTIYEHFTIQAAQSTYEALLYFKKNFK